MSKYKRALLAITNYRALLFIGSLHYLFATKPLQKLSGAFRYLLLSCLLINTSQAQTLYKIDVNTVAIYQQPTIESEVVQRLYFAENIQLLQIHNKWVKIRFQSQGSEIEGWVTKTDLKLQQKTSTDIAINDVVASSDKSDSQTLDLSKFKVSAINGDIYCNRSKDKKSIIGCVVEIDIEIKATKKANTAQVACAAYLDTVQVDGNTKQRIEHKKIRTPIKKGVGAARMQLAVIPLKDKQVKSIKLSSFKCELTALL
jgi:hypothetical protein